MHSLFKGAFNNLRFQLEACMNINQLPKCFKKAKDSIEEHRLRFLDEVISKLDRIFIHQCKYFQKKMLL